MSREYRIEFEIMSSSREYPPIFINAVIPEELALKVMATPMNPTLKNPKSGFISMRVYTNRGMLEDKTPLLDYTQG